MLIKFENCIKEAFGDYEISAAFAGRGWADLRVYNNETNEDLTEEIFGAKSVDASIEKMNYARLWIEMRRGKMVAEFS